MKRHVILACAVLLCGAPALRAQDSGPAEPVDTEIVIPDFVLEVEDLTVDEVEAVLPQGDDLALGAIELPLPDAGELSVANLAFDAPLPTSSPAGSRTSAFSTGRLGAGTTNRIVGELSVYKLGDDPRFRLGFSHEGLDGYQSADPGTGFYSFANAIDGWVAAATETLELEVEGEFAEHERGLQDLSQYSAVSLRTTGVTAGVVYYPDPLISIAGGIEAHLATRRQRVSGGVSVPKTTEYLLKPQASARIDIRTLDLMFDTSYHLRAVAGTPVPTQQDIDFTAGFEIGLPNTLVIGGHAGVHWDFSRGLVYPWNLSLRGIIGDVLELGVSGGFRVDRTSFADVWAFEPLSAVGDASAPAELLNNSLWFGEADIRLTGTAGFSVRADVVFTSESNAFSLQGYDTVADEFPYNYQAVNRLVPSLVAAWQPSASWRFEAGASGSFLDRVATEPLVGLEGALRFSTPNEMVQANLEVRSSLFPEPDIPWLGLETTISATDGVDIVVDLADILAPINDTGRAVHGPAVTAEYPFIRPGFVATILTRITL